MKMKNGRKSHSSSQWNLTQPFKTLENVIISGELHLKRKLTWNKRLVAVSAGRLICYKSEKEQRPGLVITLAGYDVTCTEREGRHGYELKLTHPMLETYHFAVECKDWAQAWAEVSLFSSLILLFVYIFRSNNYSKTHFILSNSVFS